MGTGHSDGKFGASSIQSHGHKSVPWTHLSNVTFLGLQEDFGDQCQWAQVHLSPELHTHPLLAASPQGPVLLASHTHTFLWPQESPRPRTSWASCPS